MKLNIQSLLVSTLCVLATSSLYASAQAASGIGNNEENSLRGFFDHQWVAVSYDQLALKKGSSEEVRQFAQSELDMYRSLGNKMAELNKKFGLIDITAKDGTPAPKLAEGVTRGFTTLPDGASWAEVTILGSLAGRGRLDTNANKLIDDTATLSKLSGDEFDKAYLLRVIMLHQRMLRHALRDIQGSDNDADVLAFAKTALASLNQQNEEAENIYNGRPKRPAGPPSAP